MLAQNLTVPQVALADFCRKHHIRKLAFFGSVLGNEFGAASDVDVLVEFEAGHVPGFAFFDCHPSDPGSTGYEKARWKTTFHRAYFTRNLFVTA